MVSVNVYDMSWVNTTMPTSTFDAIRSNPHLRRLKRPVLVECHQNASIRKSHYVSQTVIIHIDNVARVFLNRPSPGRYSKRADPVH